MKSNLEYAPGVPGYGTKGIDGSAGSNGFSLYFCEFDGAADITTIKGKIVNNLMLSSTIIPLPTYKPYQTGDTFIDKNAISYRIDLSESNKYVSSGVQINTSLYFQLGATTTESVVCSRVSNAYSTYKYLFDIVMTNGNPTNYYTNPNSTLTIYKNPALEYSQIHYVDKILDTYYPFTVWSTSNDTTKPEETIALVKSTTGNNWRFGNMDDFGVVRDVSLFLDFKNVYINGNTKISGETIGLTTGDFISVISGSDVSIIAYDEAFITSANNMTLTSTVGDINLTAGDDITLTATDDTITLSSAIANITTTDTIGLTSTNSMTLTSPIIYLISDNDINITTGDIISNTGTTNLNASDTIGITSTNNMSLTSTVGDINLTAGDDITLYSSVSNIISTNDMHLTSVLGNIDISSNGTIRINTMGGSLDADITLYSENDIFLEPLGSLNGNIEGDINLQSNGGNVYLYSNGVMSLTTVDDLSLTAGDDITLTATGDTITLSSAIANITTTDTIGLTSANNMTLTSTVGDINLTAGDDITLTATDDTITLSSAIANITTTDSIGLTSTNGMTLTSTTDTIDLTSRNNMTLTSTVGDINLTAGDDITLTATDDSADIVLTAGANIILSPDAGTIINGDLDLTGELNFNNTTNEKVLIWLSSTKGFGLDAGGEPAIYTSGVGWETILTS